MPKADEVEMGEGERQALGANKLGLRSQGRRTCHQARMGWESCQRYVDAAT